MTPNKSKDFDFNTLSAAYTAKQATISGQAQSSLAGYYSGYAVAQPGYTYTYPYPVCVDKTQTAFKLVKLLMDKELVTVDSVKDFIKLIDTIVGAL